jgi:hypothetical protein
LNCVKNLLLREVLHPSLPNEVQEKEVLKIDPLTRTSSFRLGGFSCRVVIKKNVLALPALFTFIAAPAGNSGQFEWLL